MVKNLFRKIQYELLIFIFLYVQLLIMKPFPQEMNWWCVTPFIFSYDYGFNSRFLMGSLLKLLFPYISIFTLNVIIYISLILLIIVVSLTLGKVIRSSGDYKKITIIIVILYLAGPASIAHLFGQVNYGRFDLYLIIIAIACLYLVNTKAKFLIPVLAFIGIAIHQVFIFTYFSIVVFAVMYNSYEKEDSRWAALLMKATVFIAFVSFIYFQFFTPGFNFSDSSAVSHVLQKRTDMPISDTMIFFEYFAGIGEHIKQIVLVDLQARIYKFLLVLILMLPMSFMIFKILAKAIKGTKKKNIKSLLKQVIFLPLLMAVPAFILTIDYGRWLAAIFTFYIAVILYLAYKKCPPVLESLGKVQEFFETNSFLLYLLIIFMALLGKFTDVSILDSAAKLLDIMWNPF